VYWRKRGPMKRNNGIMEKTAYYTSSFYIRIKTPILAARYHRILDQKPENKRKYT
jgi:hypothetical protein